MRFVAGRQPSFRLRRLFLPSLVLAALLVPGAGGAQPATYTTGSSPQYQAPAARVAVPKYGAGQQAREFNAIVAPPANIATCPTPSLAQCKTTTYLFTGCGQAHQKTCQGLLTPEYTTYFNGLPGSADRPMFPFGSPAFSRDLRLGKFRGSLVSNAVNVRSKTFWDQVRLVNPPASANPKTYVPHPLWDANGARVDTCEEYAYEKYYDWQRFQDAVTLCKGDYVCAYEVAILPATPGIAKALKRRDNQNMSAQISMPVPGASPTPKNSFFTVGRFVTSDLPPGVNPKTGRAYTPEGYMTFAELKAKFPAHTADLNQLKAAIDKGAAFYGKNAGNGVEPQNAFPNPWDFHKTLRNRTINLTENEFEEIESRRQELEFYIGSIGIVDEATGGGKFGLRVAEFVHPLSEVERLFSYDPWERTAIFQDEVLRTNAIVNAMMPAAAQRHIRLFAPGGESLRSLPARGPRGGETPTVIMSGGAAGAGGGSGAAGTGRASAGGPVATAAPAPRAVPSGGGAAGLGTAGGPGVVGPAGTQAMIQAPQLPCEYIPPMDVEACQKNALNCQGMAGPDAMRAQNQRNWNQFAKCKITNITLKEWWRRKNGQTQPQGCNDRGNCGCLDVTTSACDWSPKMFSDAYVKTPPRDLAYARDADYDNCRRWTYGGFPTNLSDKVTGDALEAYLKAKREAIEALLKKIPQKRDGAGNPIMGLIGQDFSDSAREGDLDSWSAGYNMTAGWELRTAEYEPKTGATKKTCQLQGNANASFGVKITTPIDGAIGSLSDIWNRAVDADVWVRANEATDQKVRYETHLIIGNQEIFAVPEPYKNKAFSEFDKNQEGKTHLAFNLNKAFSQPLYENTRKSPKLTLTVWAGPIPITGSVWAEINYGVNAVAKGAMNQGCKVNMDTFKAEAGFEPYFGLTGAISLGVGVGGIVSAGIRGYINLITARLPILARTVLEGTGNARKLAFAVDAALDLSSLSGRLALYVEFLMFEEEWELFRWRGLNTSIPLLTAVEEKLDFGALAAIAQ